MPESQLPPTLVMAIGRVAINGTRLETDVITLLWSALGHTRPTAFQRKGGFSPPPSDFARVISDLRLIVRNRLHGSLRVSTERYLDEAKRLQGRRHDVIHSMWTAKTDAKGRHQLLSVRDQDRVVLMSAADVDELASKIHAHRGTLLDILPAIQTAIPEITETIVGLDPVEMAVMRSMSDPPGTAGELPYAL